MAPTIRMVVASEIRSLRPGLRATHHLDASMSRDDIGCHFLNFGESEFRERNRAWPQVPQLIQTCGLFPGGVSNHAPTLLHFSGDIDYDNVREKLGQYEAMNRLVRLSWGLGKTSSWVYMGSVISCPWLKFVRENAKRIFESRRH